MDDPRVHRSIDPLTHLHEEHVYVIFREGGATLLWEYDLLGDPDKYKLIQTQPLELMMLELKLSFIVGILAAVALPLMSGRINAAKWSEAKAAAGGVLAGPVAFKLYDTYGLSVDEQEEMARDYGLSIDRAVFEREMDVQRERARASWKGAQQAQIAPVITVSGDSRVCKPEAT